MMSLARKMCFKMYRLLKQCGNGLVTLKLACCKYIGEETLSTMGTVCTSLEGLLVQYNHYLL